MTSIERATMRMETGDDGVALILFDVPGRPVNVLTPQFRADFADCVQHVAGDSRIRGAVLASAKSTFVAGADLKEELNSITLDLGRTPEGKIAHHGYFSKVLRQVEIAGKPFVAAINGAAVGGGFELCLACHGRVMVADERLRVGTPEVTLGLLPGGGGTQRIVRMLGAEPALPLLVEGRLLSPAQAVELGLIDRLVEPEALIAAARELVGSISATKPWDRPDFTLPGSGADVPRLLREAMDVIRYKPGGNYPAPAAVLRCIAAAVQEDMDTGLHIEVANAVALLLDFKVGNIISTTFVARARASSLHARPDGPKATIAPVACVGEGSDIVALQQLLIARGLAESTPGEAAIVAGRDLDTVTGVPTLRLHLVEPGEGLPATRDPAMVGAHAPGGWKHGEVVELVVSSVTAPKSLACAFDLMKALRKLPVIVGNAPGLAAGRIQTAYRHEAWRLLAEGAAPADIETAAREVGMRHGPLSSLDAEGRSGGIALARAMGTLGDEPLEAILERVGQIGDAPWEDLRGAHQLLVPDEADVRDRLLFSQLAEALRCRDAGILSDEMDGDVLAVIGLGFPAWAGGPFRYAATLGAVELVRITDRLAVLWGERFLLPSSWREAAASALAAKGET